MKESRPSINLPVLQLNKNWNPMSIIPIWKAMSKIGNERAVILDPETYQKYTLDEWRKVEVKEGDRFIQTAHAQIKVPEIMILTEYDKADLREVKLSKRNLLIRDNYTCQYTGKLLTMDTATMDHVIPQTRGGKSTWENLVMCCTEANAKKADKSLAESGFKLAVKPCKPKWNPVFARFAHLANRNVPASWKQFIKIDWNSVQETSQKVV